MNTMTRQLAAVLGVTILIAVIGTPTPGHAIAAFDRAWLVATFAALAAALSCTLLESGRHHMPASTATPDAS